jgi:predicted secreted acid phosphatase
MVFIDLSNPFIRMYLKEIYLDRHKTQMDIATKDVDKMIEVRSIEEAERVEKYDESPDNFDKHRKFAATIDIDETILSNIYMEHFKSDGEYDSQPVEFDVGKELFNWDRESKMAPSLPGAFELMEKLIASDVKIFFISGRKEHLRNQTVENFGFLDFNKLFSKDELNKELILLPDDGCDISPQIRKFKEDERYKIQKKYRIILNVGDQASDYSDQADTNLILMHPLYFT